MSTALAVAAPDDVVPVVHGGQLWAGGLSLPAGLTLEQCLDVGAELLVRTDELRWAWWDWLAYMRANHGEAWAQAEHLAEVVWGWSGSRMLNGVSIAAAFPPESRVIQGRVIRTMTAETLAPMLNSKAPEIRREGKALLKKAEAGRWTRADLRARREDAERRILGDGPPGPAPATDAPPDAPLAENEHAATALVLRIEVVVNLDGYRWTTEEVFSLAEPAIRDAIGASVIDVERLR